MIHFHSLLGQTDILGLSPLKPANLKILKMKFLIGKKLKLKNTFQISGSAALRMGMALVNVYWAGGRGTWAVEKVGNSPPTGFVDITRGWCPRSKVREASDHVATKSHLSSATWCWQRRRPCLTAHHKAPTLSLFCPNSKSVLNQHSSTKTSEWKEVSVPVPDIPVSSSATSNWFQTSLDIPDARELPSDQGKKILVLLPCLQPLIGYSRYWQANHLEEDGANVCSVCRRWFETRTNSRKTLDEMLRESENPYIILWNVPTLGAPCAILIASKMHWNSKPGGETRRAGVMERGPTFFWMEKNIQGLWLKNRWLSWGIGGRL